MDNWHYAVVASIVTILGMSLISFLKLFKLWKASLSIFLFLVYVPKSKLSMRFTYPASYKRKESLL